MYLTKPSNRVYNRLPRVGLRTIFFAGVSAVLLSSTTSLAQTDAETAMERASEAMRSGDYRDAVDGYQEVYELTNDPAIAAEALYWKAFALYRLGGDDDLEAALSALAVAREKYADHVPSDLEGLEIRINGALAKRGKASSAEKVQRAAEGDRSTDEKMAALNALLQMDADRAVPILRKVLQRKDEGSEELRKHALFLLAQHSGKESTDLLLDAARQDPSTEVRKSAVFWLSQTDDPEAVQLLEDVLRNDPDPEIKKSALFAISQTDDQRAREILQAVAIDQAQSTEVRGEAIFWVGQTEGNNVELLSALFRDLSDRELQERVLFSMSQQEDSQAGAWLLNVSKDRSVDLELRKNALFWFGQREEVGTADLRELFESTTEMELKEQIIFVAAQNDEEGGVDFLLELLRTSQEPEVREKAVFWLGQSSDPRALEAIEEIIER